MFAKQSYNSYTTQYNTTPSYYINPSPSIVVDLGTPRWVIVELVLEQFMYGTSCLADMNWTMSAEIFENCERFWIEEDYILFFSKIL